MSRPTEAEIEAAARALAAWAIIGSNASVEDVIELPFDEKPRKIWEHHIEPAMLALEAAERIRANAKPDGRGW